MIRDFCWKRKYSGLSFTQSERGRREGGSLSAAVSAFILTQQATVYVSVWLTSRQLSAQLSSPPLSVTFSQYQSLT